MRNINFYFAVAGSILIAAFFITVNLLFSPGFLWFVLACPPVVWWPLTVLLGRRAATFRFAAISFLTAVFYYGLLNLLIFPGHPWIVYIAFVLSWWPLSAYFFILKKQQIRENAVKPNDPVTKIAGKLWEQSRL